MRIKSIFLIMVIILAMFVLNGCYCCCPVCPTIPQQFEPEILGSITHCEILAEMRVIAPLAGYRWPAKEVYQLTSLNDTQKVINNIGLAYLIDNFHNQPGCSSLPFGYVKYQNEVEDCITVVMENGIKFYKIAGPNEKLIRMYPDNSITEIVLY